jgi:hypothetical protein
MIRRIIGYLNAKLNTTEALVLAPRLSGRWEKVCEKNSSAPIRYEHTCVCGTTTKHLLSEAARKDVRRCSCGRDFSLYNSLVTESTDPSEYALALNNLATKIVKTEEEKPRSQWVGDAPVSVAWTGRQDAQREKAFDAGDPGFGGLF